MNEEAASESTEDAQMAAGEQPTLAAPGADGTPAPTSEPRAAGQHGDWTGRQVSGRYLVRERIGEGGMGVVYLAEHLTLRKKVAFKVIHPELSAHEDLLLRFKREALATGQLDHPHIAAAIDFDELEGGGAFLVMPWVRGQSLQSLIDEHGAMDLRRVAMLGSQIADALSAAHSMGIVHRDLKPDNVLIEQRSDGSEAAKVLDFGVASLAGRSESISVEARPLTQAGTILGTPGYMSPEQASAGEVDHRTDLYALGVILWELCRGERLFAGDDITQIFAKQFKSVPPPLELGFSSAARELSALVTRLLAWNKQDRPDSAAEVRDALRRIAMAPEARLPSLPAIDLRRLRPYLPHVSALLLLVALIFSTTSRSGDDDPSESEAAEETRAERREKAPAARPAGQEAKPQRERETRREEPEPARVDRASRRPGPRGNELTQAQETLLEGRTRAARRTAARTILRHARETPQYLQLVADLELVTRCSQKRDILAKMRKLGDRRVLPALQRLADTPRRGCGLLRLNDCLACLRRDLDETIGALRG